jgi:hypothetical protein
MNLCRTVKNEHFKLLIIMPSLQLRAAEDHHEHTAPT